MYMSVNRFTTALAVFSVGLLTLCSVAASPGTRDVVARVEVRPVHLAAVVGPADVGATDAKTPAAAASPIVRQAATAGATIRDVAATVVGVGIGLLLAPAWYLASPIVLPAMLFLVYSLSMGRLSPSAQSVIAYFTAPFSLGLEVAGGLFGLNGIFQTNPPAQAKNSTIATVHMVAANLGSSKAVGPGMAAPRRVSNADSKHTTTAAELGTNGAKSAGSAVSASAAGTHPIGKNAKRATAHSGAAHNSSSDKKRAR
jgi:hypothetical protein